MDDIALAAPLTLNELLEKFNSFHPRLKFTMEIGGTSLYFLELIFINRDGKFIFDCTTNNQRCAKRSKLDLHANISCVNLYTFLKFSNYF